MATAIQIRQKQNRFFSLSPLPKTLFRRLQRLISPSLNGPSAIFFLVLQRFFFFPEQTLQSPVCRVFFLRSKKREHTSPVHVKPIQHFKPSKVQQGRAAMQFPRSPKATNSASPNSPKTSVKLSPIPHPNKFQLRSTKSQPYQPTYPASKINRLNRNYRKRTQPQLPKTKPNTRII